MVRSHTISGTLDPGVVGEVLREPLGARGLVQVVDLLEARVRELLDERRHVDAVGDEPDAAEPTGDPAQRPQVDVDDLVDPRSLDLDDDLAQAGVFGVGIRQRRAVRLTEGCRRQRRRIDEGVRPLERNAQLGLGERRGSPGTAQGEPRPAAPRALS